MDHMPNAPAHAKPARRPEGLIAAWLCLIIAGVTTVTFNVWHAFHSGMAWPIAILVGIAPVALAMVVSHLVATSQAGKFLKAVTFAVMVGAMVLSVRATGAVVAPAMGLLWWLFGAVIDTAALVALQVLLSLKARAAREGAEHAEAEAHAAGERTALRAELEAVLAEVAPLREALAAAQKQAEEGAAKRVILERKLAAQTASRKRANAPRAKSANARARQASKEDVDARTKALEILEDEPGISGAELGERVGMSKRWGQLRKPELVAMAADLKE